MGRAALLPAFLLLGSAVGCASAPPAATPSERLVFVQGGAGRLQVSDGGTGSPAVLFVHGLGGDLETWRPQLDRLRPRLRAVAYDQRGHGRSDRAADGNYTVEALAGDLSAVADGLGLSRFYLVGHSMSGAVLSAYAGAHPERVAGLVYVDAVADFREAPGEAFEPLLRKEAAFGPPEIKATFAEWMSPAIRPATRARVLGALDRFDPAAFKGIRRSVFNFRLGDRLSSFRGPILAIEVAGEHESYQAAALIPTARRADVAGVSHWIHLDDPDAFQRLLDPFLVP